MTETRVHQPIPEGESSVTVLQERPVPQNYRHILYVVHPSTIDGDYNRITRSAIQARVNSASADSRVVLIAPPQRSVYLEPGTQVTDIRSDENHHHWVSNNDISPKTQGVTLVGGNLERCLGELYHGVTDSLSHQLDQTKLAAGRIDVELPLDAIYTMEGTTALDDLQHLIQLASPLEAVIALLSTNDPYNFQYGYGEIEIISSNAAKSYEIELNGTKIGQLKSPKITVKPEEPEEPLPKKEGWAIIRPLYPLYQGPDITIGLKLTGDVGGKSTTSPDLARKLASKLKHARKVVLPKYEPLF